MTRVERHKKIVDTIVDFSEIFETFARNGRPIFSDTVPTACICFNVEGIPIGFVWGKDFFDTCSDYKAKFILCHEMLHIFLGHGIRRDGLSDHRKANIAMDISINHLLVDEFGFNRGLIEEWEDLCWRDTVFNKNIPKLPCFENYYELDSSNFKDGFNSLDDHEFLGGGTQEPEELKEWLDELRKKLKGSIPSHGNGLSDLLSEEEVKITKRPKFEKLVKKISASFIQKKKLKLSSWTSIDRRLCEVAPDIPAIDKKHERRCKSKYKCAFFIDNSGSCGEYLKRFCESAGSLNAEIFEVCVYSFDTRVLKVEKVNQKYRVYGGGGTNFECIGAKVEETNPDIVFILTDGFASSFHPKNKNKYFWFLTENGSQSAIKSAGTINRLSQFE